MQWFTYLGKNLAASRKRKQLHNTRRCSCCYVGLHFCRLQRLITRQRFHLDLKSLQNINRTYSKRTWPIRSNHWHPTLMIRSAQNCLCQQSAVWIKTMTIGNVEMMKKEQNAACKINRELGLRKCCKTYKNNYKCSYKHEVEATDRYILVALVSSCWSRSKSLMSLWWQWTIAQQFLTNSASLSRWTSALDSFVPAGSVAVKINSNTQLPTSLVQLLSMLATWYYPHSPVACHAAVCPCSDQSISLAGRTVAYAETDRRRPDRCIYPALHIMWAVPITDC